FRRSFPEISTGKLKKIKFQAWVYVRDLNADGKLVVDIQDTTGKSLSWTALNTRDAVRSTGEWFRIWGEKDIPADIPQTKDYKVIMYGWDAGSTPFWMDDMQISFE